MSGGFKPQYKRHMSTALLYCGNSDGFLIGMDSRATNPQTNKVEADDEQKIFVYEDGPLSVMFGWAGTVKSRMGDSEISLVAESLDILPKMNSAAFHDEFSTRLSDRISILKTNAAGDIARGIFLYYWEQTQYGFEILVKKNGICWKSSIWAHGVPDGNVYIITGKSGDATTFQKPNSLSQAKKMMNHYIQTCIDDPECDDIGGKVQFGKLTLDGFERLS